MSGVPREVYTVEEVARAAGVPTAAVKGLLASGELRFIDGTAFISESAAVISGRRLQAEWAAAATAAAAALSVEPEPLFARVVRTSGFAELRRGVDANRRAQVSPVDPTELSAERPRLLLPASARPQRREVVAPRQERGSVQLSVLS